MKKKDFSLTFMQVICAISVVTLHVNNSFWSFDATARYWFVANIIECVFYFAIPIFFMMTGITLLNYQERYSTKEYFKKRAEKTFLPYIAWSLIGIVFKLAIGRLSYETLSVQWVANGLLSASTIIPVYWFFQPLFCTYLCIPLFAAINNDKKKQVADYVVIAGFVINILIPFLNNILCLGITWPYSISVVTGYLFWIWAGYRVYYYPPTKWQKALIYVSAIVGLLIHIIGTYTLSVEIGSIQSLYKGYNNIPCVLYSVGFFVFLRDLATWIKKSKTIKKIIIYLGNYTFPLYLMHWFILCIRGLIMPIDENNSIYKLVAPFAIFFIVICITWVFRKIPGLRKIVP